MAFSRYRRRGYKKTFFRRKQRKMTFKRKFVPKKNPRFIKPEKKYVDIQAALTGNISSTSPQTLAITPSTFTQGTAVGQVVGKKIHSRWCVVRCTFIGPNVTPATQNANDTNMRAIWWTPRTSYATALAYMQSTTVTNQAGGTLSIPDYAYVTVHKDVLVEIGRNFMLNGAVTTSVTGVANKRNRKFSLKFMRNMELAPQTAAPTVLDVNENKDIMYVTVYGASSEACGFISYNRLTYTDV